MPFIGGHTLQHVKPIFGVQENFRQIFFMIVGTTSADWKLFMISGFVVLIRSLGYQQR